MGRNCGVKCLSAHDRMVDDQHHDRADGCDKHTVDIEPTDTFSAELGEQKAADHRSDDFEHNVENNPLARFVDNLSYS